MKYPSTADFLCEITAANFLPKLSRDMHVHRNVFITLRK